MSASESDQVDTKKFGGHVMKDGVQSSAAAECKRLIETDGTTGAKSDRKYKKREDDKKIQKMHYHIRNLNKPLSLQKYAAPQLAKRGGGKLVKGEMVSEMYHIHCCWELGPDQVAFARIPCNCVPCRETIRKEWVPRLPPHEQPRFLPVENCKYRSVLGDRNNWYFCTLNQRKPTDTGNEDFLDDAADLHRWGIREHITAVVGEEIRIGCYGAIITTDPDADGYYLVKWTGTPYTSEDTAELVCDGVYLTKVGGAPKWYTINDPTEIQHMVKHVVLGKVEMEVISDTNKLPNTCNKTEATEKGAIKISKDSDDFIFDETFRRDRLEDPDYNDDDQIP